MKAVEREKLEDIKKKDVKVYDEMPKGWKILKGAQTAPVGYVWIWNGKSRFGADRAFQQALLKQKEDNEEGERIKTEMERI